MSNSLRLSSMTSSKYCKTWKLAPIRTPIWAWRLWSRFRGSKPPMSPQFEERHREEEDILILMRPRRGAGMPEVFTNCWAFIMISWVECVLSDTGILVVYEIKIYLFIFVFVWFDEGQNLHSFSYLGNNCVFIFSWFGIILIPLQFWSYTKAEVLKLWCEAICIEKSSN